MCNWVIIFYSRKKMMYWEKKKPQKQKHRNENFLKEKLPC